MPRRSGKTHQLITISKETGYVIATRGSEGVDNIFRMARDMRLVIPRPITYHQLISDYNLPRLKGVLIDDLDLFLKVITKQDIVAATITGTSTQKIIDDNNSFSKDEVEELIAKYWYENEYEKLPESKKDESRIAYKNWIDLNLEIK